MRVLVMPASKHGATAEIGRAITKTMREAGIDVDVAQPDHMHDLTVYRGFVLGSALYLGKWLPAATRFIRRFDAEIRSHPTWLFSSGPLGEGHPDVPIMPEVLADLMARTDAVEHRLFAGRLELDRLRGTDRFLAKWVGAPEGDYRPWPEIEAWAAAIAEQLT